TTLILPPFPTRRSSDLAHFNPTNKPHAGSDATERHVGDMGNVEADASGKANLEYVDHHISLTNDQQSVIGRSVVVHAKADDLKRSEEHTSELQSLAYLV